MAKRIKAAFECKKQAGAISRSLRLIFTLVKSTLMVNVMSSPTTHNPKESC